LQTSGLGNETGGNSVTYEGTEVGGDEAHLVAQIGLHGGAALGEFDGALGKVGDVLQIRIRNVAAHGNTGGIDDGLGNGRIVIYQSGQLVQVVVSERSLVLNDKNHASISNVVGNNLDEFGEVPRVPFTAAHSKGVDGFVEMIESGDGLDDVIVVLLDGELDLCARVGVTKTKLGLAQIAISEGGNHLFGMLTNATDKAQSNTIGFRGSARNTREGFLDAGGQILVGNSEDDVGLGLLGKIGLENRVQEGRKDALGNVVDVLESLAGTLERGKGDKLDHFACAARQTS